MIPTHSQLECMIQVELLLVCSNRIIFLKILVPFLMKESARKLFSVWNGENTPGFHLSIHHFPGGGQNKETFGESIH